MIEISDLTFAYKKKQPLFKDMFLSFSPGSIYGVLGKNGAGKTSLLKLISGLINPQKGKAEYNNQNVMFRTPATLREYYFLPEICVLPSVKISEYLEMYSQFYPNFSGQDFKEYLENFEINWNENISNLSFGQKKKIALAFAFAVNTNVLLLDEPTNGLDIPSKSVFRKIISSAVTDEKLIIVSTHQIRDMKNIIDQVMIIEGGDIVFNFNLAEIEEKLSIIECSEKPSDDHCLYSESSLSGYTVLTKKEFGEEQEIDLEFLFNAVIANGQKINGTIKRGGENE